MVFKETNSACYVKLIQAQSFKELTKEKTYTIHIICKKWKTILKDKLAIFQATISGIKISELQCTKIELIPPIEHSMFPLQCTIGKCYIGEQLLFTVIIIQNT
jgi:hypothetical protein